MFYVTTGQKELNFKVHNPQETQLPNLFLKREQQYSFVESKLLVTLLIWLDLN